MTSAEPFTLWNPHAGLGAPTFVDPSAPWHPFSILAALLDLPFAPHAASAVSGALLYRLLRGPRALRLSVAFLGGITLLLFCRPDVSFLALGLVSAALAGRSFARRADRRSWIGLTLVAAAALVGFQPMHVPLVAALLLWLAWRERESRVERPARVSGVVAAIAAALLLTAFWWWPAMKLPRSSWVEEPIISEGGPPSELGRVLVAAYPAGEVFASPLLSVVRPLVIDEAGAWRWDQPFFDFLNIRTIATPLPLAVPGFRRSGPATYANAEAFPRFFFVRSFAVIPDPKQAARALAQEDDLSQFATVDHIPAKITRMSEGRFSARNGVRHDTADGKVKVRAVAPGRRVLDVSTVGWGLLVSSEPWWPGWRVYRNGERLPPVTVNAAFTGTFIPPGRAAIRFRYRPASFDFALRFGAVGMLIFAWTAVWPWYLRVTPYAAQAEEAARSLLPGVEQWVSRHPARALGRTIGAGHRLSNALLRHSSVVVASAGAVALVVYFAVLFQHRVQVAGGADASGYLNQARLWLEGRLIVPLTMATELGIPAHLHRAFVPLGFLSGPEPASMVPSYPPGLPLHMALAGAIGGETAPFLIGPLAGLAAVILIYLLARDMGLSRLLAGAGATVLGLCPVFLFHAIQPMSDVPATTWTLATILCARRGRQSWWWAAAAGACLGIGVLVRPTHLLIIPALVVAIGARWRSLIAAAVAAAPFGLFQMFLNHSLYGGPFVTGYESLSAALVWAHFPVRFSHYSFWLAAQLTPLVFPLGLAVVSLRSVRLHDRLTLLAWFAPVFLFYCFYFPHETWWYTRFLLPAVSALILGSLLTGQRFLALGSFARRVAVAAAFLAVISTEAVIARRFAVLDLNDGEQVYIRAVNEAVRRLPPNAMVLTMQLSGAWYYYTGTTTVRWDTITSDDFQLLRAHAGVAGRRWYALLSDWEVDEAIAHTQEGWEPRARVRDVTLYALEER